MRMHSKGELQGVEVLWLCVLETAVINLFIRCILIIICHTIEIVNEILIIDLS